MPQGLKKNKIKVPGKPKEKNEKKPLGLKKGHYDIAPKKSKLAEERNFKKTISKMIQGKVEKDVMMMASKIDNKKITNKPAPSANPKKPQTALKSK